jgi:hypothetical protein
MKTYLFSSLYALCFFAAFGAGIVVAQRPIICHKYTYLLKKTCKIYQLA